MTNAEGLGGLFGSLITLGVGIWGVKKIDEALDSKKKPKSKSKSILKDTEPFN